MVSRNFNIECWGCEWEAEGYGEEGVWQGVGGQLVREEIRMRAEARLTARREMTWGLMLGRAALALDAARRPVVRPVRRVGGCIVGDSFLSFLASLFFVILLDPLSY